ncbi:MAG: hypothetical protein NTV86_00470 [Planctomycetota bacterium]|nr:hypothetical protein [Planctomycetota bacterium]
MKARAEIDAGVCGFQTVVVADCDDGQNVTIDVQSGCEKIRAIATALSEKGTVDAYQEMSPAAGSTVLGVARERQKAGCAACAVPIALFKAVQVAAGLALPKDISIKLSKE